jgi:uncharacterized protein
LGLYTDHLKDGGINYMHVLITGGTGLIGQELAASLISDGHEVTVLSRDPEKVTHLPDGVNIKRWDTQAVEGWQSLTDEVDTIVNLAGENISEGRWTVKRKLRIRESRVNAGRALVYAMGKSVIKPRVIIQASAVGYYGSCGDEEITENMQAGEGFLPKVCMDWEASTAPVEVWGIRRVIIRTGVVLSKKGGALPRMLLPFRYFVGGRLGSGNQWFPWIHIADEVGAIRFLIDNEAASGPFNLVSPNPVTNAEFSRLLGRQLKRPSFIPVPAIALRLLFGEMSTVLLDGQRAVPQRLIQLSYNFQFPNADTALHNILV